MLKTFLSFEAQEKLKNLIMGNNQIEKRCNVFQKQAWVHFTEKKKTYLGVNMHFIYILYVDLLYLTFRIPRSIYTFSKATVNLKVTLSILFENVHMFIGMQLPSRSCYINCIYEHCLPPTFLCYLIQCCKYDLPFAWSKE